jgi:hypothetical protein
MFQFAKPDFFVSQNQAKGRTVKLPQAYEGYFLSKELQFSQNTVRNYSYTFRYLNEFLGDVELESVTSDDIRRFLVHLGRKRKMSKRSVHDAWIPLSSLWTWAEKELGIPPYALLGACRQFVTSTHVMIQSVLQQSALGCVLFIIIGCWCCRHDASS